MTKQDINITRLYVPSSLDIVPPKPLPVVFDQVTPIGPTLHDLGFDSWDDLSQLVADVDLSTAKKQAAFVKWKLEDGTKAGLLALSGPREIVPGGNKVAK